MLTVCVLYFTILNLCKKKIVLRTYENQLHPVNVCLYFLYVLKEKSPMNFRNVANMHFNEFNVKLYVVGFPIYAIVFSLYNELYVI